MGKSAPSPPPAPSPTAIAQAQGAANVQTATAQSLLNNVDQTTPFGTNTFQQTGSTDVGGNPVPSWAQTVTPSPSISAILNPTLRGAQSAAGLINPQGINLPSLPTVPGAVDPQGINQTAAKAAYDVGAGFLDPQFDEQKRQLDDQLSSQGIKLGSAAYDQAMKDFGLQKNQAYTTLENQAVGQGASVGANLTSEQLAQNAQRFGEQLTQGQQNITQQVQQQQFPVSLLQSILGGAGGIPNAPQNPAAPVGVQPNNVTGAYGVASTAANNAFNAQAQLYGSQMGGLGGLLGTAGLAASLFL